MAKRGSGSGAPRDGRATNDDRTKRASEAPAPKPSDPLAGAILAAADAPEREELWDDAERLAAELSRPEDVAALYRTVLSRELEPALGVHLGARAVAFHGEWFEDAGPLVEVLRRVLELDASQTWAFDRLSMLLTVAERWGDLLALYDRVLPATTDPARRAVLLHEAAHAAKDFAGRPDRAIGYLEDLFARKPGDAQVAASLERLLEREHRYADLVRFWATRADTAPHDAAQALRARIAACRLDNLSDAAGALEAAAPLLDDPAHGAAAAAILERIIRAASAGDEARRGALTALSDHYAAHGRPSDVARALEASLGLAVAADRPSLHRRIAALLVGEGRERDAVDHLAALVVLEPASDDAREELCAAAARTGRLDAYAAAVAGAADASSADEARACALRVEAARVYADELGAAPRAIELYGRVFRADAADGATALAVSRRLRALLDPSERAAELLDVLERLAVLEPEEADRREALGVAAKLADGAGDPNRALALWRRRLDADSADREALDAVVGLLERAKRYEPLIKALQSRAAAALDDGERREDLTAIATIYADRLDALPQAIDAWREVERTFGPDAATTDALDALLARAARWDELAELLEAAAAHELDAGRRVRSLGRLGAVCTDHLADPARATRCFEAALALDPAHSGSREGLAALLEDGDRRADAARVLAVAFAATDDFAGTLRLLPHRLATAEDDAARTALLLEAARLREERAQDLGGALAAVAQAMPLSPADTAIEAELQRLAFATGSWGAASDAYAQAIARCADPARLAALHHRHGIVLESSLGDLAGALAADLAMLALVPDSVDAAEAAVRVAARSGSWDVAARATVDSARVRGRVEPAVVAVLEAAAGGADAWETAASALWAATIGARDDGPTALHAEVVRELGLLVAGWHRDRRSDPAAAEQVLTATIARAGASVEALRVLADLQRRAPGRAFVETLLALAAAGHAPLDSLREAAEVALRGADPTFASTILERLFAQASARWVGDADDAGRLQGFATWALDELVRLSTDAGDHMRALLLLVEGARLPFSADDARAMVHRAAAIAADDLSDADRAIGLYRGILEGAPSDVRAIERLGALYELRGRLDDLVALRRHQIGLTLRTRAPAPATAPNGEAAARPLDETISYVGSLDDRPAETARTPSAPPAPEADERRLALRLDIAALLGRKGDLTGRLEALRENLAERPGHAPSIDELAGVLEEAGRAAELCDVLTEQAATLETRGRGEEARALWERTGALSEERLGDLPRAIAAHARAVALAPTAASLDALARLHVARGQHAAAVGWLERRAEIAGDAERGLIVARLAQAHVATGRADRARACLEEALAREPSARALRDQLAALHRAAEGWDDLVRTLVEGVRHTDELAVKLACLREAAEIELRRRRSPAGAIPLLEQATALAPQDRPTRTQLADALRETGRLDEAQTMLGALVEEFGRRRPAERAELHHRLAQVARARGDRAEAIAQLEAATTMDVGHAGAFRALGDLYRDGGELERAERAYRALLLIVLRRAREPGEASGASEVLLELYRIARRLEQAERAAEVLASAFDAAAECEAESRLFERALDAAGERDLTLRALEARLARTDAPAAAALVLTELADVHDALGHAEAALDARLQALSKAPEPAALHEAARAAASRAGASARYADTLDALAARASADADAELACQLCVRLGEVLEHDVGAVERAREAYARAEETGAAGVAVWRALDRLCGALGDRDGQLRALRQLVLAGGDDADGARQTDDLYRLAEMELGGAETLEQGIDTLVWALDREARNEPAAAMLREASAKSTDASLLALFERVARATGEPGLLLEALERAAALETASIDVLREAVDLATTLEQAERAEALLQRAVEVAEADAGGGAGAAWALGALADRHEASGDVAGAVGFLRRAAEHADPADAPRVLQRVAELAAGPLDDLALAAETYERLLEREPGDKAVWEPMLAVYRRRGDGEALEARLASIVDSVFEAEDRARLRLERAKLLLARGERDDDAIAVLREILDEDPSHDEAGDLLIGVCERLGRDEALAELLARRLDAARDRGDAAAVEPLALRLATLHAGRRADAAEVLRAALRDAPSSRPLLEALLALLDGDDDAAERADVLERLLAFETGEAAGQRALAAADARAALGDEPGVERALEAAFRACPDDAAIRARLSRWYEEHARWSELAGLLSLEASGLADPAAAARRLREAAAIHRDKLSDPKAAARALRDATARTPHDLALVAEHARCLASAGDHEDAAQAVAAALEGRAAGSGERLDLLRLRAELRTLAGEHALALSDLELGFEEAPSTLGPELLAALERARARAAEAADVQAERAATLRLCDVARRLDDPDRAARLLTEWTERQTDDVGALGALLELCAASARWQDVSSLAERLVRLETGDARVAAALRLVEATAALGQPDSARGALETIYREQPSEPRVHGPLEAIYERAGAHRELAELCAASAALCADDDERFAKLRRAGHLWLHGAREPERAIEALASARQMRADDHEAVVLLADAYMQASQLSEATGLLSDAIAAHKNRRSRELAVLQQRMARVAYATGDRTIEIAWLNAALDTDKQSPEIATDLADAALAVDDLETATKALRTLTSMKAATTNMRAVAMLRQGQIAHRQGDVRRAILMARKAQSEDPELAEAASFLAELGG